VQLSGWAIYNRAMHRPPLLRMTTAGLYCEAGGFHVDPCAAVARAIVTHAHADHFARGCQRYLTSAPGRGVLAERLAAKAVIDTLPYGERLQIGEVSVSLHPAGHVLGSAQVRIEHQGEVWVVTGDYQLAPNSTCAPFEPLLCQHLVTESTFGHPFFRWSPAAEVFSAIHAWWRENQAAGRASLVFAYSFGKAQRLLGGLDRAVGPVATTREVAAINAHYAREGIDLGETLVADEVDLAGLWDRALFVLPPVARWKQPFPFHGRYATAFASGWMLLPGEQRRRRVDRGFALSDHADHREILSAVEASGAETVWVMHGYVEPVVKELRAQGRDARAFRSPRCKAAPDVVTQLTLEFADPQKTIVAASVSGPLSPVRGGEG
jgi:putative mRNA 3-end processing factor